jgi:hypothetical protein
MHRMDSPKHLIQLSRLFCGRDAQVRIFEPLIADLHYEWSHASGARRLFVGARGGWAFVASVVRCLHLANVFAEKPRAACAALVLLFGLLGAALTIQPLNYRWRGPGLAFDWYVPWGAAGLLPYFLPYALATTIGLALLPAMILATVAGWSVRRRVTVMASVMLVAVVLEGWVAPAAMYARNRDFIERLPEPHRGLVVRQYASTSEVIATLSHPDETLARAAALAIQDKAEMLVMALSFAFLGIALGRARASRRARVGMLALVSWWLIAWFLYDALHHWSEIALILLSIPRHLHPWFAATIFGLLSVTALIATVASENHPSARTE